MSERVDRLTIKTDWQTGRLAEQFHPSRRECQRGEGEWAGRRAGGQASNPVSAQAGCVVRVQVWVGECACRQGVSQSVSQSVNLCGLE